MTGPSNDDKTAASREAAVFLSARVLVISPRRFAAG
jgi:hypothetical protein